MVGGGAPLPGGQGRPLSGQNIRGEICDMKSKRKLRSVQYQRLEAGKGAEVVEGQFLGAWTGGGPNSNSIESHGGGVQSGEERLE